jgi:site-specific DNA-methyltransferase (adenine-specific)
MVALFVKEDFSIKDRGLADIQRFKWSSRRPSGHPAEKPLPLIKWIINESTKSNNQIILDPFCGSGTTCVAAKKLGCRYIGIELSEDWGRIARNRLRDTERPLFPAEGSE